jgi:hypothetical protein
MSITFKIQQSLEAQEHFKHVYAESRQFYEDIDSGKIVGSVSTIKRKTELDQKCYEAERIANELDKAVEDHLIELITKRTKI